MGNRQRRWAVTYRWSSWGSRSSCCCWSKHQTCYSRQPADLLEDTEESHLTLQLLVVTINSTPMSAIYNLTRYNDISITQNGELHPTQVLSPSREPWDPHHHRQLREKKHVQCQKLHSAFVLYTDRHGKLQFVYSDATCVFPFSNLEESRLCTSL